MRFYLIVIILLISNFIFANVQLPAIISNNMVIQADVNVVIWGWAEPDEVVTVTIYNQKHIVTSSSEGKWEVKLEPLEPTGKPTEMIVKGRNSITINNILVGEVWLGSGQSNICGGVSKIL